MNGEKNPKIKIKTNNISTIKEKRGLRFDMFTNNHCKTIHESLKVAAVNIMYKMRSICIFVICVFSVRDDEGVGIEVIENTF